MIPKIKQTERSSERQPSSAQGLSSVICRHPSMQKSKGTSSSTVIFPTGPRDPLASLRMWPSSASEHYAVFLGGRQCVCPDQVLQKAESLRFYLGLCIWPSVFPAEKHHSPLSGIGGLQSQGSQEALAWAASKPPFLWRSCLRIRDGLGFPRMPVLGFTGHAGVFAGETMGGTVRNAAFQK